MPKCRIELLIIINLHLKYLGYYFNLNYIYIRIKTNKVINICKNTGNCEFSTFWIKLNAWRILIIKPKGPKYSKKPLSTLLKIFETKKIKNALKKKVLAI